MDKTQLEIERVSLHVTFRCNLSCEKCCVRAVEYRHKYNPALDFIKKQIDEIFNIADKINFFAIEGGEPLLRKDFTDIIAYMLKYKDKIGIEMPVVTNGTIIPNTELINTLKKFGEKALVIVDNYGKDYSPNANAIEETLKNANVRCIVKDYYGDLYCGGWIDLYGQYELKHNLEKSIALHSKCAWAQKLKGVLEIMGGMVFFCPPCRMLRERDIDTSDGYIDMLDESISLEEKREKIRSWYNLKAFNACMYCNGIHDESERFKPAVQLTKEQLKEICVNEFKYREKL